MYLQSDLSYIENWFKPIITVIISVTSFGRSRKMIQLASIKSTSSVSLVGSLKTLGTDENEN